MDAIDVGIASLGLPADVLDVILKYSDLRTRYAAVHVCHEFCDSYERLSPQLEFGLLLKRFPLLGTVMEAEVAARGLATVQNFKQEVRELFRTYSRASRTTTKLLRSWCLPWVSTRIHWRSSWR